MAIIKQKLFKLKGRCLICDRLGKWDHGSGAVPPVSGPYSCNRHRNDVGSALLRAMNMGEVEGAGRDSVLKVYRASILEARDRDNINITDEWS